MFIWKKKQNVDLGVSRKVKYFTNLLQDESSYYATNYEKYSNSFSMNRVSMRKLTKENRVTKRIIMPLELRRSFLLII